MGENIQLKSKGKDKLKKKKKKKKQIIQQKLKANILLQKKKSLGLPWPSSDWDFMLLLHGVQV